MLPRRVRLAITLTVVLVLALAVIGLVRTVTTPAGLTEDQFTKLVDSGSLAGIANDVVQGPEHPAIDADQVKAAYLGAGRCSAYWEAAARHLVSQAAHVPTNPDEALVEGITTELWDDPAAAQAAMSDWAVCLEEYQHLAATQSYPLRVVSRGTTAGVAWQYQESNDLTNPMRILVLRERNVITTLRLPDAPHPDWRSMIAMKYHADLEKAVGG